MEEGVEHLLHPNLTDELNNFDFEPTARDVLLDVLTILFTVTGLIANIFTIYVIARNLRKRSKTNVLLLNFAINDALCLLTNARFLVSIMQISVKMHTSANFNCAVQFMDVIFQINQTIFLLLLISNTMKRSKRVCVKWVLIFVYTSVVLNFLSDQFFCEYEVFPFLVITCVCLYLANLCVILCKEVNNCYKKWYKKDPLSARTTFRLTIGRIYIASWSISFVMYEISDHIVCQILSHQCFMTSLYIFLYIINADMNFKTSFWNLVKCERTGGYDVNASDSDDEEKNKDDFCLNGNTSFPIHDLTY